MQHSINIGDNGIAYVNIVGDGDVNVAKEFVAKIQTILNKHPGKVFDAIIDMTKSGASDYEGIRVYRDFFKNEQIGRMAFVKVSDVIKALVTLAVKSKMPSEINFFDSVEEAEKWLKRTT